MVELRLIHGGKDEGGREAEESAREKRTNFDEIIDELLNEVMLTVESGAELNKDEIVSRYRDGLRKCIMADRWDRELQWVAKMVGYEPDENKEEIEQLKVLSGAIFKYVAEHLLKKMKDQIGRKPQLVEIGSGQERDIRRQEIINIILRDIGEDLEDKIVYET